MFGNNKCRMVTLSIVIVLMILSVMASLYAEYIYVRPSFIVRMETQTLVKKFNALVDTENMGKSPRAFVDTEYADKPTDELVDIWTVDKITDIHADYGNMVTPYRRLEPITVNNDGVRHRRFNSSFLRNKCSIDLKLTNHAQFNLRIFVLTFSRAASLKRLLASLNEAKYGNSSVKLEVWIDRSLDGRVDENTLSVVRRFKFYPGVFQVCVHEKHVGIMGQWLIPWKPQEDSEEIAVFLEDDLTVSPYFYKYLKMVHSKYRHMPEVNGFALQGVSIKHIGENAGYVNIPSTEKVYLYPTLGTWGFSPGAINWIRYLNWFEKTYPNVSFQPLVPNHVDTYWYRTFIKQGKEDSLWDIWHIYHSWFNGEWTLYPNFPDHKGLTFNWKENGLHYQGQAETRKDIEQNQLLLEWKQDFENLPEVPVYVDNAGNILPPTKNISG